MSHFTRTDKLFKPILIIAESKRTGIVPCLVHREEINKTIVRQQSYCTCNTV